MSIVHRESAHREFDRAHAILCSRKWRMSRGTMNNDAFATLTRFFSNVRVYLMAAAVPLRRDVGEQAGTAEIKGPRHVKRNADER